MSLEEAAEEFMMTPSICRCFTALYYYPITTRLRVWLHAFAAFAA